MLSETPTTQQPTRLEVNLRAQAIFTVPEGSMKPTSIGPPSAPGVSAVQSIYLRAHHHLKGPASPHITAWHPMKRPFHTHPTPSHSEGSPWRDDSANYNCRAVNAAYQEGMNALRGMAGVKDGVANATGDGGSGFVDNIMRGNTAEGVNRDSQSPPSPAATSSTRQDNRVAQVKKTQYDASVYDYILHNASK